MDAHGPGGDAHAERYLIVGQPFISAQHKGFPYAQREAPERALEPPPENGIELGLLTSEQYDQWVKPEDMIHPKD